MGRGVVNCVDANIRRMVETALKVKTTTVIIAHNHPNGVALPSREDDNFTRTLYRSLGLLGITLEDHIIVANDEFVSLGFRRHAPVQVLIYSAGQHFHPRSCLALCKQKTVSFS